MRKVVVSVLLLAAFLLAMAQKNIWVMKTGSKIAVYDGTDAEVAFRFDGSWLAVTCGEATGIDETEFSGTVTVAPAEGITKINTNPEYEVGVCYKLEKEYAPTNIPTVEDSCLVLGTELNTYNFSLAGLSTRGKYHYRGYVKVAGQIIYSDLAEVQLTIADHTCVVDGHRMVDLGLPSGILWADMNVGATQPYESGGYFAWGETTPRTNFLWTNYAFARSTATSFSKYNYADGLEKLEEADDAATVNWGSGFRIPTFMNVNELMKYCTISYVYLDDDEGNSYRCVQYVSNVNGNMIYIPCAGYLVGTDSQSTPDAYVWSRDLHSSRDMSYALWRGSTLLVYRYYGVPVRPIMNR